MKILIAADTYYPSVNGASYFAQRLAAMLGTRGHEVCAIIPSQKFKNTRSIHEGVSLYGVHSVSVPIYPGFRVSPSLFIKKTIEEIIHTLQPDVVHIQDHFMIGKTAAIVAKKFHIPVVGTNHFMPENLIHYFHLPSTARKQLKKFGWNQFLDVYRTLDAVTTPTRTAARLIREMGFTKKVFAISCGIDCSRFKKGVAREDIRKKYGIPKNKPVALYVGRLDEEKRIETIIRSLPLVLSTIDIQLVLVGMGKLRRSLEELVKEIGVEKNVTFAGFVADSDLPEVYRAADVFVIAAVAELQSIVTMEAMASGLPVIAVDAMALPELVHDGKNGYLFQEGDTHMLARRIRAILGNADMRSHMSAQSLEIIHAHDINNTIAQYESIYKKVLA